MAQLTMGDYQRILENPDCWDKLGWTLDAGRWTLDAGSLVVFCAPKGNFSGSQ
jgi:hypothetical protein